MTLSLLSGTVFLGSDRIDLGRGGHQGNALIGGDGHALRRADHGARHIDLADDLGRRDAEIDNGDVIGRRVFDDFVHAVDVDDLGVVRRHGELRARRGCNCEGGEAQSRNAEHAVGNALGASFHRHFLP